MNSNDLYQLTAYALALGPPWRAVIIYPRSGEKNKKLEFTNPETITVNPPGLNVTLEIKLIGVPMNGLLNLLKSYNHIPEKELKRIQKQLELHVKTEE